jgi:hypothetical protein
VAHSITVGAYEIPFDRTLGVKMGYGGYGMFTLAALPYFISKQNEEFRLAEIVGVLVIMFSTLFITQSRSSWIAMAFGISMSAAFILLQQYSLRKLASFLTLCSPALLLSIYVMSLTVVNINRRSVEQRVTQYRFAISHMMDYPVFGSGSWGEKFHQLNHLIHNPFLRIGTTAGSVALFLLLFVFLISTLRSVRLLSSNLILSNTAFGIMSGLFVILVESQFAPSFSVSVWILVAMSVSVSR